MPNRFSTRARHFRFCRIIALAMAGMACAPAAVCVPDGFTDVPVNYFDDFAWRAFVAMVWPAAPGHRGVADAHKTVGASGPRVFETMKSLWEVFHEDGSAP